MVYEDVKLFLKENNFLDEFDHSAVQITYSENDLDIDYMIDIYKIKRIIASENENADIIYLSLLDTIIENLSAENKDVKIRIITLKSEPKVLKIITNSQLSKTYGVLYL